MRDDVKGKAQSTVLTFAACLLSQLAGRYIRMASQLPAASGEPLAFCPWLSPWGRGERLGEAARSRGVGVGRSSELHVQGAGRRAMSRR